MTGLADLKPQSMHPADRDAESYETAQSIQQANPDWLVMWGVYSRQYVAFPLFRAPSRMHRPVHQPGCTCSSDAARQKSPSHLAKLPPAGPLRHPRRCTTRTPPAGTEVTARTRTKTGPPHRRDRSRTARQGQQSRCPMVPGPQTCARAHRAHRSNHSESTRKKGHRWMAVTLHTRLSRASPTSATGPAPPVPREQLSLLGSAACKDRGQRCDGLVTWQKSTAAPPAPRGRGGSFMRLQKITCG